MCTLTNLQYLCLLCCTDVGSLKLVLTYLPKLKLVCAAVEEVNLQGFSDGRCIALHHTAPYTVQFLFTTICMCVKWCIKCDVYG